MGGIHESRQQLGLLADCLGTKGGELVVATAGVMRGTGVVDFGLTDQLVGDQSSERSVQRARPQPNLPVRELINEPHHGVPMAVAGGQRQQHLEARRRQRRQTTCRTHIRRIQSVTGMTIMDISGSSIRMGVIAMGKIVVVNNVTLDGVTQGPGRPDEDTRGGFEYGGWGIPYADQMQGEAMGKSMAQAILLGRRTYEDFYGYWPKQTDNPYTEVLNQTPKYVASTTAAEPLPWQNSTLLSGDLTAEVAALRDRTDGAIAVLGSGELVRWLAEQDLVDEYLMLIHPLVLGSGTRLFAEKGPRRELRLTDSVVTTTGVVIATYDARVAGAG